MEKLTESKAGKAGIAVFAAVAVAAAVFAGVRSNSANDSKPADDKEIRASAQKAIESLQNDPNLPPEYKAEMIAHQQGLLRGPSKSAGGPAPTGPAPTGATSGG